MMRKLFNAIGIIIFMLVTCSNLFAQNDFDGYSPTTKPFKDLCYPIKAGSSVKVPIKVTCNITKKFQPYTVSIDINSSFYSDASWVTIDNNSQNVDSSKTITFNLTIKPTATPYITPDGQYPFELSFIVYNKDNARIYPTFTKPAFKFC
ncbi:MAG: hypothetical protein HOO91_13500 [Bacteroidales bacterium]|nr:hypothetical protein [Bacteroidales bacterium]